MWLSKSVYELLPYLYLAVAVLLLAASTYVDYWYWRGIAFVLGAGGLVAGLVVWWKRREFRRDAF